MNFSKIIINKNSKENHYFLTFSSIFDLRLFNLNISKMSKHNK